VQDGDFRLSQAHWHQEAVKPGGAAPVDTGGVAFAQPITITCGAMNNNLQIATMIQGFQMRIQPYLFKFLRALLKSSKYNREELNFLSLPLIREVVYRLFSITTPFALIPAALVSWKMQQWLVMGVQAVIAVVVILHAWLLLKRNYRLLSPFMMFSVSIALYILAVSRGEEYALFWASSFTGAFYLLFERQQARYINAGWVALSCVLTASVFPLEPTANLIGSLATTGLFIEFLFVILNRNERHLEELAERDPLTNALNRRRMMEDLEEAVTMRGRYQWPASIVIIDVDRFKMINDTFGHQEGDTVLRNLATRTLSRLRTTDRFYRYGGEEFVAFLTSTDVRQAAVVANSLCELIRTHALSSKTPTTISCGVAEVRPGDTVADWIARGDAALYRAKNNGRDRVEIEDCAPANPLPSTETNAG
jgi:diguanylate cyclase (GGDEF)-like protein